MIFASAHHPDDRNVPEAFSAVYMSPLRVLKATVPGQEFLSSCRRPRKLSSLPQERSLSPETPSSMWLERLTSSVSLSHEKKKTELSYEQRDFCGEHVVVTVSLTTASLQTSAMLTS